ncbi:extracellular solute-binding protein [Cohnella phaseoli]|uniref:Putative aldouronate transport system substrate-binding protein n=1 Tax=Cohnella phaseoli TaxID=456490 RepID=A0A3D9KI69_9BACL|nr:extracellular solute-binding protein [Cohnella phaseoli]RED85576.1 putative aldouronate transport system substrate-binding protein [Cohnella phaseoli]
MTKITDWVSRGRLAALMLAIVLVVSACSSNSGGTNNGSQPSPGGTNTQDDEGAKQQAPASQGTVELIAYFPGDTPQDFDRVLGEVNKKLEADGIGAKLNISFIPWDDYGQVTQLRATAGEKFDMFLEAQWLHIEPMIADKAIIPLDEYVANSPNLLASIPELMWEQNKFHDRIYGIPLGTTQGNWRGFTIRKDLREKHGFPEITTVEQLEAFLYLMKEKEPALIPFGIDGRYANDLPAMFDPLNYSGEYHNYEHLGSQVSLDVKNNRVLSNFEIGFLQGAMERIFRYVNDGILDRNLLQEQNSVELFNNGQFAATIYEATGVEGLKYLPLMEKVEGAELEFILLEAEGVKPISRFEQWNFLSVPASSDHPEKVIEVMDWLSIQENHDLLEYGIEGVHWEAVGEDAYQVIKGTSYEFPGYVMTWRPDLVRMPSHMHPDDKKYFEMARHADTFQRAVSSGFTPDLTSLNTEIAQLNSVLTTLNQPLSVGLLDPKKYYSQLVEQVNAAGMDRIVEEIRQQYEAFTQK